MDIYFLKHNKQYIEDGEIKNDTIDGSMDMNDWFFNTDELNELMVEKLWDSVILCWFR